MYSELLEELLRADGFIMANKRLIKEFGLHEAILLGELFSERNYWRKENKLIDNEWFYSTRSNLEENTGLTPYYQREALQSLINAGLVETKKMDLPAKIYYRVVDDKLLKALTARDKSLLQQDEKGFNINNNNYNNKENNNVMDKPLHPATPGLSKHRDKLHRNAQTLTDDLGGISQYEKEDRPKKKNLFTKCSEEIDNTEYQFTDEVKEALREYLPFATDTSSEKRLKGVNMWKGKLKQLIALSKDSATQVKIVRQSINKGWFCFEPLGKTEYKDKYNRSSSEVKRQELHGEEVIEELKRRAERNGVY